MDYFNQKSKDIATLRIALFCITSIFCILIVVILVLNHIERKKQNTEMWAIDPGSGMSIKLNKIPFTLEERKSEYRAHVRDFLTHFYQFDQYTMRDNLDYASNLIDKKTRDAEIAKYREEHTYEKLQERDIILSVVIKTIDMNVSKYPIEGSFILEQTLRTNQYATKRIIEGIYQIEDSEGRSYQNPHMAIIKNYQIIRQEPIKN